MVALLDLEVVVREMQVKGIIESSFNRQFPGIILLFYATCNLELPAGAHSVLHADCEILLHKATYVEIYLRVQVYVKVWYILYIKRGHSFRLRA